MMKQIRSQRYISTVILILFIIMVAACEKRSKDVADVGVSFEWNLPEAPLDQNPEIHLTGVPEATHRFLVELVDLDLKPYNHGGGYYPYNGSLVIPAGELDGYYQGPSPPPGVVHQYQFTVKALDAAGVVIGEGRHTRQYPESD